jgi:hypothetical protein
MMTRKPNLPLPTHDGVLFTWHNGVGIAEASCLAGGKSFAIHGRVWNDSCDVGFNVRSHRTGAVKTFVYHSDVKRENEIVLWVYRSADGTIVHVLND